MSTSKADIVSNILLFFPFGFFLVGSIKNKYKSQWVIIGIVTISGFFCSSFIELCQTLTQMRISSTTDIVVNTFGSLFGGIVGMIFFRCWYNRVVVKIHDLISSKPLVLVVYIFLTILAVDAFFPFDISIQVSDVWHGISGTNLSPFENQDKSIREMLVNKLLPYIILSILIYYINKHHYGYKMGGTLTGMALCLLFLIVIEIGQIFIVSRTSNINDIIYGFLGVVVGLFIISAWDSFLRKDSGLPRQVNIPEKKHVWNNTMLILLILFGSYIVYVQLNPFDFTKDLKVIRYKLGHINLVPLLPYFYKTDLISLLDFVKSVLYFIPFGFLMSTILLRGNRLSEKASLCITLVTGFLFGSFLEFLQIFLISRHTDITDIISFMAGTYLGIIIYNHRFVKNHAFFYCK